MKFKGFSIVLVALLAFNSLNAQTELWYFGRGNVFNSAGMFFDPNNGNNPVQRNFESFQVYESISVVADGSGNPLFYSDGLKINDATHTAMPNGTGLLGSQENNGSPITGSSLNGVMIAREPGSNDRYVVMTINDLLNGARNGLRYSIVDMTLVGNGTVGSPLGDVDPALKNVVLLDGNTEPTAEMMTAAGAPCADTTWIVVHGANNNTFYSVPFSTGGVFGTPVESNVGPVISGNGLRGSLAFNSDASQLSLACMGGGANAGAWIFNFNPNTGVVSATNFGPAANGQISSQGKYGTNWSPDDQKVYYTSLNGSFIHFNTNLAYNAATNPSTIEAGGFYGSVKTGPDGVMYVGKNFDSNFLGTISNPNAVNAAGTGWNINGYNAGTAVWYGLPNTFLPDNSAAGVQGSIDQPDGSICDTASAFAFTASPAAGDWSTIPSGLINANTGVFDPATAAATVGDGGVVQIIYGGNCILPDTIDYTINVCCLPINVNDAAGDVCVGETIDLSALVVQPNDGVWTIAQGTGGSISGNNTFNSTGATAGAFKLYYSLSPAAPSGCQAYDSIEFNVNALPIINLNSAPICQGETTTLDAGNAGASYLWSPSGNTGQTELVSTAGPHKVIVTLPGTGCVDSAEYTVTVNPLPTISITAPTASCDNESAEALVGSPAGGDWFLNDVPSISGQFDPAALGDGTHEIKYTFTDGNGCSNADSIDVVVNAAPTVVIDPIAITCSNDDVVTMSATPVSGSWFINGNASSDQFDPSANVGNNTVKYSYTDGNGCADSAEISVNINTAPVASIDPVTISCNNDDVFTLTGGPNATGDWILNGVVQANNQFDPSTNLGNNAIRYAVTENGCFDTADLAVTINAAPLASIDPITITCSNDGVISLTGGPNATGDWILNGAVQADNQFDPSNNLGNNAIRYAVTENGCFDTADVNVNINAAPVASIDPVTISCNNDDLFTLTGGPNATGDWILNGVVQANNQFDPSTNLGNNAIQYAVTENGCFDTADLAVTINAAPVASIDPITITCSNDGVISLTGGPNATGDWILNGAVQADNQFDPSNNLGNNAIRYAVTENGCFDTADINVNINAAPVASIDPVTISCNNDDVFTLTGGPNATGDWILNGVVQANDQFDPSTNLGNNAIRYAVTENGCFDTVDLAVTINAAPVASIDPITITCSNDGVISLTGGSNANGDWILNGTVQADNQFDPSNNVGNNAIRYAVTENGCFDTADVNVTINAAPTAGIDASNTVWCSNESVTLTAQPGAGFNYTWSQNGLNSTDQVVSVAGEGPFRLVIQDQTTLCYDTTSIEFTAQLPNPFLGADDSACTDKVFMLTPGDYPSYVWSTGENDTTITFGLVADTTIWVDVTDAQGCTNRDSIKLTLRHPFVLEITGDSTTCSNGFAMLTAVGTPQVLNATYWWTGDASTSASASYNTAGLVKVIVTDEDNCTDSATTTVTVNPTPVVSFVNEVDSFCSLGQEVYDAKLWVNGDSTTQAGQYIFNLETYNDNVARFTYAPTQVVGYYTDLNGCADADTLNLEEYCEPTIINLPNVFVPGGLDNTSFRPLGMNDANFIELFNNIVSSEFTVYNRWGLKVFQSGNVIPNWDGMFENRPVASGTYFWVFKYKDSSLKDYHLNGFVQVIQQRD